MEEFYAAFFRDLGVVSVFAASVAAAVWVFSRRWIESKVDARFSEQLENHKHELDVLTEHARYVYSRSLADATLYSGRKDAAAADMYAAFRKAHGALLDLKSRKRG